MSIDRRLARLIMLLVALVCGCTGEGERLEQNTRGDAGMIDADGECGSEDDCPPGRRICAAVDGARRCLECLRHADCPTGHMCGPDGICGGCGTNADCTRDRPYCGGGDCHQCLLDGHCGEITAPICVENRCSSCAGDEQCPGSLRCVFSSIRGINSCEAVCDDDSSCPESHPACVESMRYVRQCCRSGGHPCLSCRSDTDCPRLGQRCLEDGFGGVSCR